MNKYLFLTLGLASLLTACQSMTPQQCSQSTPYTWYNQGFNAGASGELPRISNKIYQNCQSIGVTPNHDMYQQGYQAGLKHYCTANNALQQGMKGYHFNVERCPADRHIFVQANNKGLQHYDLTQKIEHTAKDIKRLRTDMDNLRHNNGTHYDNYERERVRLKYWQEIQYLEQRIDDYQRQAYDLLK
ncbi:MAG: DUF2799 domain-containing protein [Acinetobacter sp.]|nr:DUF2799 domain-containing protein [Acinetobacter sp.]